MAEVSNEALKMLLSQEHGTEGVLDAWLTLAGHKVKQTRTASAFCTEAFSKWDSPSIPVSVTFLQEQRRRHNLARMSRRSMQRACSLNTVRNCREIKVSLRSRSPFPLAPSPCKTTPLQAPMRAVAVINACPVYQMSMAKGWER